ncbi:hypothetical protein CRUP_019899 [Coryphaenoides rupestris]|nr:hypothetical protein CRUP_019899 [Coryphaenoides rupestris]
MFLGSGNKEAGRVYIYTFTGEGMFVPNGTLKAEDKSQDARFGYAMAAVPDLNHDGFTDLLRIAGLDISPTLQYFGRSVSARLDMDGDELIDLAVGAQGSAVLLSSRSIVQVNVSLSFQPHSINVIQKTCQRGGRDSACLNATACFLAVSRSPGPQGHSFDLWVSAMLDDRKLTARALFDGNSQRQKQMAVHVQTGQMLCYNLPFHVYDTADYIRPISFSLRFKINDTESGPVLDEGWPTTVKKFDCGEDDVCTTDLVLSAHMDISGTSDSVEREDTLADNSVQLQSFVQYEPDLFIISDSKLNRYEVHPSRTLSEAVGPEFYTNFKATGVNCSVLSDLAQLKGRQRDVRPLHPEDMQQNDILNCSRSWCVEVVCDVQQLLKGQEVLIRVSRRVQDEFFRKAKYKSVKVVGTYRLAAQESHLITLGAGAVWRETVLEVLKGRAIPISLWILIGSIIGGLLLLALIIFVLWKLGFFTRKQPEEEEETQEE